MRIFVVGTGRCGTSTFYHACRHATNYTVGHESRAGRINDYCYHDNYIEVSSHLAFAVPLLMERNQGCRFVHIIRSKAACVASMAETREAIKAFAFGISEGNPRHGSEYLEWAAWLYDLINANITATVQTAWNAFLFHMDYADREWEECWRFMGCEGDFEASLAEWRWKYNAGEKRGRDERVAVESVR